MILEAVLGVKHRALLSENQMEPDVVIIVHPVSRDSGSSTHWHKTGRRLLGEMKEDAHIFHSRVDYNFSPSL